MKGLLVIWSLCFFALSCYGQAVVPLNIRATNTLERLQDLDGMGIADLLYGIPLPEGKVIGDSYLNSTAKIWSLLLYAPNKPLEGCRVRYDIQSDALEISARNGVRILTGSKVKSFVWIDEETGSPSYFVNGKELSKSFNGFFKVLVDGQRPLFERVDLDVKKADYNIQLNVGSLDDKILKKTKYYTSENGELIELPSSRRKLLHFFSDRDDEMALFMKDNNLTPKKGDELAIVFRHYNQLIEP